MKQQGFFEKRLRARPAWVASLDVTALLVVALSTVVGTAHAQNAAPVPVSLRMNWQMKGEFTPFIVAVEKGFFRDRGLAVTIQEGSSGTQALQALAAGQDDFAYVPSVQLIEAVNTGLPVKAIATIVKVDAMGMVSKDKVPLASPKDLEGRNVEISASSTFSQIWPAFARRNDIDMSKVNVVRVNPSARFNLLLSDKVDVLADIFMTNELPILSAQDPHLHTLVVGDWGFRMIGYTLAASHATIDGKADMVKRFTAAAAQGFRFTIEHPAEAAAISSAAYPKLLLPATTDGQVKELVAFLGRGEPKALFLGSDDDWSSTLDILRSSGTISTKKPVSDYYTNAFVPDHG